MCLCTAAVFTDSSAHLVNLTSNGQGAHFLSANDNTYYVAIDSDNNVQALHECKVANVGYRFSSLL